MNDCIFCKIVAGQIPANVIYEDELCMAILDAFPATLGHTLIIPKVHTCDLLEIEPKTLQHIIAIAQQLAIQMMPTLNAKGVNIINNNRSEAGQTVFHFHVHLVFRYDNNDGIQINFTPQQYDLQNLKDSLRSVIKL